MSLNLKKKINQLKFISEIKDKNLREKILKENSNDDILFKSIKEIVLNAMNKNIPIDKKTKKGLSKYKRVLSQFLKPKVNVKKRKKLISQSGGFLPYLIPIVVSVLSSILK